MTRALRPSIVALAATLVLFAGACAGGDDVELTLRAESSSGEAVVSYRVGSGERLTETVSTPWEHVVEAGGKFDVDLTVANVAESGSVACGIELTGSTLSNPSAQGEAAADCSVAGSSQGGTLSMSSNSFGTPFDEAPVENADEPEADEVATTEPEVVAIPDGMSAALLFTDANGDPIEPAQFDRVWVSIVVEGALGADDVQVLVEGEIDDGVTVLSLNDRERKDADDIDSTGRIVHVLRAIDLELAGTLRAEFAGEVKIDDVYIPVDDRLVVEVAPTETVVETRVMSEGFVTLDIVSIARPAADVPVHRSAESSESRPFTIGDLTEVASVELTASDVAVFQVDQSQTTTLDEVADAIEALFADAAEVERVAAEIDGRPAVRIEFVAEGAGTADVVVVDGEILYVQTRWTGTGAAVQDARDSIRFDPSKLLPPEG